MSKLLQTNMMCTFCGHNLPQNIMQWMSDNVHHDQQFCSDQCYIDHDFETRVNKHRESCSE